MYKREYCYGIYRYFDNETGDIVYIGKDSHIDKNQRHKEHLSHSQYDSQVFNRVLQNNPDRYRYDEWYHVESIEELNQLEFDLINLYRPKFNFHHGGCSKLIDRKFKYTVTRYGRSRNGRQKYAINDMNQKPILQSIDHDYLLDIASKLNNNEINPLEAKNLKRKIKLHLREKINSSKSRTKTGFYGLSKAKCKSCKDESLWTYGHVNDKGKRIRFFKSNFFDLKKEVVSNGLPWQIVDIDKAIQTVRSIHTGF